MSGLILASKSAARQAMLQNAGIEFDSVPADIDEEKIQLAGGDPGDISKRLADEKALYVSKDNNNSYIIGSDQVLSMNNKIYAKAKDIAEAKERLAEFSGQSHILYSSVSVAKEGKILFCHTNSATLIMKELSADKINDYCAKAGDVLTRCVGCYAIEGHGIRLFKAIDGDYFTILGMPLLPLISYLETEGLV
jgi:septum formation protein